MSNVMSPTAKPGANSLMLGVGIAALLSGGFSANQAQIDYPAPKQDDFFNYSYSMFGVDTTRGSSYKVQSHTHAPTGTERLEKAASAAYLAMVNGQESLGEEFAASLSSRLWDLYEV